jgi:dipeptidyl aminopeptidase/acylaminoacyl peptidase
MTDERIDALIRRLDVPSDPDPYFVRTTYAALRPRARAARVSDASRVGRLQRDLRLVLSGLVRPPMPGGASAGGIVVLVILAATVALAVVGALSRVQPIQNGPLVVSIGGELQVIDAPGGSVRTIPFRGDDAHGVSRSPNGRLIAFWTIGGGRSRLYVLGVDGQNRRELASDVELGWTDAIDTWSSDSQFLATQVVLGDLPRIAIVNVATGTARLVTPPGLTAQNPLWSPDNRWIAFTKVTATVRTLAVIRTDGTDMRTISGDVTGVSGPDTWSPDGAWIYFDSGLRVYRANVAGAFSQPLTSPDLEAAAPASSPDGTRIVFIVNRSDRLGWDLYAAQSDGTGARRLLEHATSDGWSADGRYVLAEWTPTDQPGGLAVVALDGSEFRVVLPLNAGCQGGPRCTDGVGWGQPRP